MKNKLETLKEVKRVLRVLVLGLLMSQCLFSYDSFAYEARSSLTGFRPENLSDQDPYSWTQFQAQLLKINPEGKDFFQQLVGDERIGESFRIQSQAYLRDENVANPTTRFMYQQMRQDEVHRIIRQYANSLQMQGVKEMGGWAQRSADDLRRQLSNEVVTGAPSASTMSSKKSKKKSVSTVASSGKKVRHESTLGRGYLFMLGTFRGQHLIDWSDHFQQTFHCELRNITCQYRFIQPLFRTELRYRFISGRLPVGVSGRQYSLTRGLSDDALTLGIGKEIDEWGLRCAMVYGVEGSEITYRFQKEIIGPVNATLQRTYSFSNRNASETSVFLQMVSIF